MNKPCIQLDGYQMDAVNKLKNGNILCGGVGSGKSRTSIAYYYIKNGGKVNTEKYEYMQVTPKDLYIITTARKRDTCEWEGELAPFLMSTNPAIDIYDHKVVVDSWNNIGKYIDIQDAFFIFDEQRVVGSGAWVKAFLKITKCNEWILLTATPGDTWTDYIPVFIANGFYKNRTEFLRRHAVYSYYSKYPKIVKFIEQGRLIKLKQLILVEMDYTRPTIQHKEDVMVEYDRVSYKKIANERWDIFNDKPVENISELCYLMRKVVNSDESRIDAVQRLCDIHPKVIIFYNFDYELDILKSINYADGTEVAEWNGHEHEPIPDSKRWVYLVNYMAGAEGWNCIETDTMIFYSQSYSYKTMVQASGRIDRRNTPFTDLFYYNIKSNAPIDIGIAVALRKKRNFNESSFFG